MIFSVIHDPFMMVNELNQDLEKKLNNWAYQLSFNPDTNKEAVELLFSHKIKMPIRHQYFNAEVLRVNEHKKIGDKS